MNLTNEELIILIFDNSLQEMMKRKQRLHRQAASILQEIELLDKEAQELYKKIEEARQTYLSQIKD